MNIQNRPFISIVIPCYNEKEFIGQCLDSIIDNDYPKDLLEVLVVDGMSSDGSRDIVKTYIERHYFIKLLDNPKKITSCAFNAGIKISSGDVVMLMGSHSIYKNDYISQCIKYLLEYNADNVGGIIKTVPGSKTHTAKAIALSLTHPFGVGNSAFRIGATKPQWVDTVFGGCYKRKVFETIGYFNENLVRSQDMDFNIRLTAAGGRILLVPTIVSIYYAKKTIKEFFNHNFDDGLWAIYPLKFGSSIFKIRHLVPLAFVLSIFGGLVLSLFWILFLFLVLGILSIYLFTSLYFSLKLALKSRNLRYLFILPIIFASRHFGYGFGSLLALIKINI